MARAPPGRLGGMTSRGLPLPIRRRPSRARPPTRPGPGRARPTGRAAPRCGSCDRPGVRCRSTARCARARRCSRPARTRTWSPRSPCSRCAGTAWTPRSSSPTSCCRWWSPGWTSRSSPASGRWSPTPVRIGGRRRRPAALEPERLAFLRRRSASWSPSSGPTPLIGFAGAPFTLATYLIEGGPSKEHARTKAFMYGEPEVWHGCWTSWRSRRRPSCARRSTPVPSRSSCSTRGSACCSAVDYAERVLPHSRAVFDGLGCQRDVPADPLRCGHRRAAGADRGRRGRRGRRGLADPAGRGGPPDRPGRSLQGNLDPAVLLADRADRRPRGAAAWSRRAAPARGHVFNLGHGVLPDTDPGVAHPRRRPGARALGR